jgi:hypothetical protein
MINKILRFLDWLFDYQGVRYMVFAIAIILFANALRVDMKQDIYTQGYKAGIEHGRYLEMTDSE